MIFKFICLCRVCYCTVDLISSSSPHAIFLSYVVTQHPITEERSVESVWVRRRNWSKDSVAVLIRTKCPFASCLVEETMLEIVSLLAIVSGRAWGRVLMYGHVWEWGHRATGTPVCHVNNNVWVAQMWYIKQHISYLAPWWKINGRMAGRIPNERWINVISSSVYWDSLTALAHKRKYLSGFSSQDNIDLRWGAGRVWEGGVRGWLSMFATSPPKVFKTLGCGCTWDIKSWSATQLNVETKRSMTPFNIYQIDWYHC